MRSATPMNLGAFDQKTTAEIREMTYISLATKKKSGTWVWTAVWFAPGDADHEYYIFSAADAGKVKRLRNFSDIQVAPCTSTGKITGQSSSGLGRLVDDPDECEQAYRALRSKYGWQMGLLDFFSRLSGRIHHRQVISIKLDDSPNSV
jgi:PPOX class probable F420-dependent enzyme